MLRRHRWSENLAPLASAEQPPEGHQLLSGYEDEFVNAVDEDLTCPVCKLPLRSPVLTSCGHRFCKGCIDELCKRETVNTRNDLYAFVHVRQVTCPIDRTKLLRDKDVFPDKFTERKILSLIIKCPNKGCQWTGELKEQEDVFPDKFTERKIFSLVIKCSKEGCEWTGELKEKENHRKCCPREVVKCTNLDCRETMARNNLKEHVTTTCQWRMIRCEHCSMHHPACEQSEHQLKCKKFPVNCPRSCGKVIPREETKRHTAICPEEVVKCTHLSCRETMARKSLKEHVTTTCQWRMIRCEHCSMQHLACEQSEHQSTCKRFPVNCFWNCGQVIPREEQRNHREICPEQIVGCTSDGCTDIMARKNLEEHVTTTCQWRMICCENCSIQHPACVQSKHREICPEEIVDCISNGCKDTMARKNREEHVTSICQWRMIRCEHCSMQHPACKQSDHQLHCKRFPVTCHYNCGEEIPREEMEAHFDTVCPIVIVSCPFAEMYCQTKVRRSELSKHVQTATNDHLDLARAKLTKAFEEHEELKQCTRLLEEKLDNTLKEHEELKKTTRKLEEKLNYTVHVLLTMKN
ncbi:uncharacterized protein LOC144635808 isoform X2 [Oculina patagonica]